MARARARCDCRPPPAASSRFAARAAGYFTRCAIRPADLGALAAIGPFCWRRNGRGQAAQTAESQYPEAIAAAAPQHRAGRRQVYTRRP
ncbi:hypothetical protein AQ611_02445 [Burkholderia singularis]|nr:hypothetical protein AQ611_02445 [Burkholderia sp. Bp7605]